MDFLEGGEKARKTGWVPKAVRKDQHNMENVDEFFNDTTEMSNVGRYSPCVRKSMTPIRNVLRAHSQSEINQKKTVGGLMIQGKYAQERHIPSTSNLDLMIERVGSDLNNPCKETVATSYETNYDLDSGNEISTDGALSDGNDSENVPYLDECKSSGVSEQETSFNTSDNAVLELECEQQELINQSADIAQTQHQVQYNEYPQGNNISDASDNDSYDSQNDSYVDDHIAQTGSKIRKSSRIKVPTLDYWRNERIVYKRKHPQQTLNIDKIITFVEGQHAKKATKQNPKSSKQLQMSLPPSIQDNDSEWLKDGLLTVRPSGQSVNVVVAMAPHHQQVSKTKSTKFNNFTMNTLFNDQNNFASGQLKIPVKGLKSQDNVGACSVTFHVTKGVIKVWINGQPFTCPTETTIQVPSFNTYKIVNIGRTEATIFFVQVCKETEH
ncbi:hypothetical protein C6P45_001957 [Maudiozyma exigua]|uniref:Mif2/CENP-C cupin domain-containing protein n=1 Tax=Maudiozyma exigua TaxID=34358 RepID=A0A9P6WEV4_MAUEX|nr:hypothetical protein C6P45_001957 [Kazachstania exigua]